MSAASDRPAAAAASPASSSAPTMPTPSTAVAVPPRAARWMARYLLSQRREGVKTASRMTDERAAYFETTGRLRDLYLPELKLLSSALGGYQLYDAQQKLRRFVKPPTKGSKKDDYVAALARTFHVDGTCRVPVGDDDPIYSALDPTGWSDVGSAAAVPQAAAARSAGVPARTASIAAAGTTATTARKANAAATSGAKTKTTAAAAPAKARAVAARATERAKGGTSAAVASKKSPTREEARRLGIARAVAAARAARNAKTASAPVAPKPAATTEAQRRRERVAAKNPEAKAWAAERAEEGSGKVASPSTAASAAAAAAAERRRAEDVEAFAAAFAADTAAALEASLKIPAPKTSPLRSLQPQPQPRPNQPSFQLGRFANGGALLSPPVAQAASPSPSRSVGQKRPRSPARDLPSTSSSGATAAAATAARTSSTAAMEAAQDENQPDWVDLTVDDEDDRKRPATTANSPPSSGIARELAKRVKIKREKGLADAGREQYGLGGLGGLGGSAAPSLMSSTSSTAAASDDAVAPAPRDWREGQMVELMKGMGFDDVREILGGLRRVEREHKDSLGGGGIGDMGSAVGTGAAAFPFFGQQPQQLPMEQHVERAMMWIVGQREEAEEARKMDAARISSEEAAAAQAAAVRAEEDDPNGKRDSEEQRLREASLEDIVGVSDEDDDEDDDDDSNQDSREQNPRKRRRRGPKSTFFPRSELLHSSLVRGVFLSGVSSSDDRAQLIRVLSLERRAYAWYGAVLPWSYFRYVARRRFEDFAEGSGGDVDGDDGGNNDQGDEGGDGSAPAAATDLGSLLKKQADELEAALFSLSEQEDHGLGNVPRAFLNAQRTARSRGLPDEPGAAKRKRRDDGDGGDAEEEEEDGDDDDDDEVIVVAATRAAAASAPEPPEKRSSTTTATTKSASSPKKQRTVGGGRTNGCSESTFSPGRTTPTRAVAEVIEIM